MMADLTVRTADASDIPSVVELLAHTFEQDPSLGWVVRKANDPQFILHEYFRILVEEVYLPHGRITVAVDGDTFLGAALWLKPDVKYPKIATVRMLGLLAKTGKAISDVLRYKAGNDHTSLPFPHWYLFTIAVPTEARGRGVGTLLLDEGIEFAGDSAIYLEATSYRAGKLYQTKGFVPLQEIPVLGPDNEIAMCRPSNRVMDAMESA